MYKKQGNTGIPAISIKLYENARHETLNETNKADVYNDVLRHYTEKCVKSIFLIGFFYGLILSVNIVIN